MSGVVVFLFFFFRDVKMCGFIKVCGNLRERNGIMCIDLT